MDLEDFLLGVPVPDDYGYIADPGIAVMESENESGSGYEFYSSGDDSNQSAQNAWSESELNSDPDLLSGSPVLSRRRSRRRGSASRPIVIDDDTDSNAELSPDDNNRTLQNDDESSNETILESDLSHLPIVQEENNNSQNANKRKRSSEEETSDKKPKTQTPEDSQEDSDGCPICFEQWTLTGKHRLSSLRCGHLFGHSCIARWMKQGEKKCPHCNTKARISDIRVLYAKKLTAIDNTELERALQNLEKEKKEKRAVEMQLAQYQMKYHQEKLKCDDLQIKYKQMQQIQAMSTMSHNLNATETLPSAGRRRQYHLLKCFTASNTGNCRVMDYSENSCTIVHSQPSPHSSFMSSRLTTGNGLQAPLPIIVQYRYIYRHSVEPKV